MRPLYFTDRSRLMTATETPPAIANVLYEKKGAIAALLKKAGAAL